MSESLVGKRNWIDKVQNNNKITTDLDSSVYPHALSLNRNIGKVIINYQFYFRFLIII